MVLLEELELMLMCHLYLFLVMTVDYSREYGVEGPGFTTLECEFEICFFPVAIISSSNGRVSFLVR